MTVYDVVWPRSPRTAEPVSLAPRPASLEGKRIAFLAATWPDLNDDWTAVQKRADEQKNDKVQAMNRLVCPISKSCSKTFRRSCHTRGKKPTVAANNNKMEPRSRNMNSGAIRAWIEGLEHVSPIRRSKCP